MSHWLLDSIAEKRAEAMRQVTLHQVRQGFGAEVNPPDRELLDQVATVLEWAVLDLLRGPAHDDEEKNLILCECSSDAFQLLRAAQAPADGLEQGLRLLRLSALGVLGDRSADVASMLKEQEWNLPLTDEQWDNRTWATVVDVWLRLYLNRGWNDHALVLERIKCLRADQMLFEKKFLNNQEGIATKASALELIGLYHLAKAAETLAFYLLYGPVVSNERFNQRLKSHFAHALAVCDDVPLLKYEPLTRLLAASSAHMVDNLKIKEAVTWADEAKKTKAGYRIDLGVIEAELNAQPGMHQGLVLVQDSPKGRQLVAFATADESLDPSAVLEQLSTSLPDFMVPASLTLLNAFPSNNGEIDINLLPKPKQSALARVDVPLTPTATVLATIWLELLGVDKLRASSNFFELGGNSLLVTRLVSLVERSFNCVSPIDVYRFPTLGKLAEHIASISNSVSTYEAARFLKASEGPMVTVGNRAPLSSKQKRMWFFDHLFGPSNIFNIHLAAWAEGAFCLNSLQQSLNQLVVRQEALRTRLVCTSEYPEQLIEPYFQLTIQLLDLNGLDKSVCKQQAEFLAERIRLQLFDLERGPLVHLCILRLEPRCHLLVLTQHEIISDRWSLDIFMRELAAGYAAAVRGSEPSLPALPIRYADYANSLHHQDRARLDDQLTWWKEQLKDMPTGLNLSLDEPGFKAVDNQVGTLEFELVGSAASLIKDLKVTPFMFHLAVLAVLLARYSGQEAVTIGTPVANRNQAVYELIGAFSNTLALPIRLNPHISFVDLLRQVRTTVLEGFARADSSFDEVLEKLQPYSQRIQVLFVCDETLTGKLTDFPGLSLSLLAPQLNLAKFDLNFSISHGPESAHCVLIYNSQKWKDKTMTALTCNYQLLYQNLIAELNSPVDQISLPGLDEHRLMPVQLGNQALMSGDESLAQTITHIVELAERITETRKESESPSISLQRKKI